MGKPTVLKEEGEERQNSLKRGGGGGRSLGYGEGGISCLTLQKKGGGGVGLETLRSRVKSWV